MSQASILHQHLENLVAIHPKTDDQIAVYSALAYCKEILDRSGHFSDAIIHTNNGYHSLTASTSSTKHPKLLLEAHIDVVPACKLPARLEIDTASGTASGRGAYDMLFAVASYLAFIQNHADKLPDLDFGLMITGEEELGGFDGVAYLLDQDYSCDVCFLPDAGEGFGDLSISAKGVYNFDLVAKGKSHHGSRPWEGDGAGNKLIHVLHRLLHEFDETSHDNSTMTITGLTCGEATNQGPNLATAHLDIRYKDAADFARIKGLVDKLCAEYGAETDNVLMADNLALDPKNPRIMDFLKLYKKHNGSDITLSKAHGGSDARFFASRGTPVIMLRPDGSGAHGEKESISLSSLDQFYRLMEEYILATTQRMPRA